MTDTLQSPERRNWLLHVLTAGVAATVGAIVYPVLRFLWPRPVTSSGAMRVVAPYRVHELRPDAEGRWPPPFNFGGKPCLLVLTPLGAERLASGVPLEQDDVRAFNAICTHTDCTVQFRPEKGDIFCNCHNGVYNVNGRNVSGPPPRPLEAYKVLLRREPGGRPGQEEIIVART